MGFLETETNMSLCEIGDCMTLNTSSCERLYEAENDSFVPPPGELYDADGCFHTHQLRGTGEYQTYLQVRGLSIFFNALIHTNRVTSISVSQGGIMTGGQGTRFPKIFDLM